MAAVVTAVAAMVTAVAAPVTAVAAVVTAVAAVVTAVAAPVTAVAAATMTAGIGERTKRKGQTYDGRQKQLPEHFSNLLKEVYLWVISSCPSIRPDMPKTSSDGPETHGRTGRLAGGADWPSRGISATRTGTDSERRLFFDRACIPVFRSIADPVGEVARAADRPESGQDELKAR